MKTLALVFLLFATTATIQFDTSKLPDGGTDAKFAGSRRVMVEKRAGETVVRVEEGERVDTITLIRIDGQLEKVTTANNGKVRPFIAMDRPKVLVDGIDLEPYLTGAAGVPSETHFAPLPRPKHRYDRSPMRQREYMCPRDGTVLRVPTTAPQTTYKCPVDGTPMEAGLGPNQRFWRVD
jgi:hypothetical protein